MMIIRKWMQHEYVTLICINCFTVLRILVYRKNSTKKDKENKTKQNYVQRTTIYMYMYSSHIGTQQINSNGTSYILMC